MWTALNQPCPRERISFQRCGQPVCRDLHRARGATRLEGDREPKGICEIRRRRRHRIGRGQVADVPGAARHARNAARRAAAPEASKADFTLRIAPVTVELTPTRIISTIGYNGTSPGPVLRMKEGKPVTVDVINETDVPELVHWHGLFIPAEVDGVEEENTPMVPPHGRIRYQFTPRPAGTRWYHTHTMAGADLHRGAYTGQFGFLMIESASNPGNYDQEVFLALREWEPFFNPEEEDDDDASNAGPQPERPKTLDTNPSGLEVGYQMFSINDKALGAGEPIRVQPGQRVLMHLLNASASMNRRIALPGHKFQVIAMDGNPVPTPQSVDVIYIGPGRTRGCHRRNEPAGSLDSRHDDGRRAQWRHGRAHRIRQSAQAAAMDRAAEIGLGLHDFWKGGNAARAGLRPST